MIKLFIGGKGSGKTQTLIDMVNNAVTTSNGNVVCIEKGEKLRHEVTYNARLINTEDYSVNDAADLYGFIAGIFIVLYAWDVFFLLHLEIRINRTDVEIVVPESAL